MVEAVYLEDFGSRQEVFAAFEVPVEQQEGVHILLAYYGERYGYDGERFVLFEREGKLYEVNGRHCSCYGLEDQWAPEEADPAELRQRLTKGDLGLGWDDKNSFRSQLIQVLAQWEAA